MGSVVSYFKQFDAADTTVPGAAALLPIARALDQATEEAVTGFITVLRKSKEHRARVALLDKQPITAGKFACDKILFKKVSPFEQMAAVCDWLQKAKICSSHTFFLASPHGDYVPLQAKKFKTVEANMMHVILGSTTGSHKAPKYTEWAEADPWKNTSQKVFVYSLEALEIVRQPNYSAATMLKGNPFELDIIDTKWRYGAEFSCVESRGQSKNTQKKQRSSGLTACTLADKLSDASDPKAKEADIILPVAYEAYADEGYNDGFEVSASPYQIIKAAKKAIVNKDDADLNHLMEMLTIAKLGVPKTPLFRQHIAQKLKVNA